MKTQFPPNLTVNDQLYTLRVPYTVLDSRANITIGPLYEYNNELYLPDLPYCLGLTDQPAVMNKVRD